MKLTDKQRKWCLAQVEEEINSTKRDLQMFDRFKDPDYVLWAIRDFTFALQWFGEALVLFSKSAQENELDRQANQSNLTRTEISFHWHEPFAAVGGVRFEKVTELNEASKKG